MTPNDASSHFDIITRGSNFEPQMFNDARYMMAPSRCLATTKQQAESTHF